MAGFYAPDPIVKVEVLKPAHPIFYGYDARVSVRYANGPFLTVPERLKGQVLAQFTGVVSRGLR